MSDELKDFLAAGSRWVGSLLSGRTDRADAATKLIDQGDGRAALQLLTADEGEAAASPSPEEEALKARAYKRVLFQVGNLAGGMAREVVEEAISGYTKIYESEPDSKTAASLSLVALATIAERIGAVVPEGIDPRRLATEALEALAETPEDERGAEYHSSRAQALLATDNLGDAAAEISELFRAKDVTATILSSCVRQLSLIGGLSDQHPSRVGLVDAASAATLQKEMAIVPVPAANPINDSLPAVPSDSQFEAIFGSDGANTFTWYKTGLERANAVGLIRRTATAEAIGTGFLVRGGDFVNSLGDELCVMTNAHVVSNAQEDAAAAAEGEVEIVFEAVSRDKSYPLGAIRFHSLKQHLDATLLLFSDEKPDVKPLPIGPQLPIVDQEQRIYVIGYPLGGELSFSLTNNILLEHEGPNNGTPPDPTVRRLQYRAPTEKGSSGSPVFNQRSWQVIGLHHAGGSDMARLNGKTGTWQANEAIWIQSIVEAGKAT